MQEGGLIMLFGFVFWVYFGGCLLLLLFFMQEIEIIRNQGS